MHLKKLRVPCNIQKLTITVIRPIQSNVYNIFDPTGLKLMTRLRLS